MPPRTMTSMLAFTMETRAVKQLCISMTRHASVFRGRKKVGVEEEMSRKSTGEHGSDQVYVVRL